MTLLILFLGLLFITESCGCPSGWIKFEADCYWIERTRRLNWQNAKNQCISMNAFLVKIYSDRENNFIRSELRKLQPGTSVYNQFWTAANDLQTEGVFVWAGTNDLVNEYTDWSPNEPNQNGGQEDCVAFFPAQDYHWNDEHCDKLEHFICEKLDTPIVG